jgi:uncharacterized protein (TIGR03435 family)
MKNLAVLVCLGAATTIAPSARLSAQSFQAFDVASIKPSAPGTGIAFPGMVLPQPDGSVRAANATLRDLVAFAFDVEPDQITGASGWQLTARFNIEARPSAGAAASNSLTRERMQSLLRERFTLRAHTESRDMSVSALVLADKSGRLGPNLKPTTADCAAEPGACRTFVGPAGGYTPGTPPKMSIRGVGAPLSLLAKTVGQAIGAKVVDRTGLTGLYDFETELAMDPDLMARQLAQAGLAPPGDAAQAGSSPAMSTILQQRLGLKLEPQRAPITFVVIDSAEQPSAN